MDDQRFDDLTRALAGGLSRRGLMRGAPGALGGILVGGWAAGRARPIGEVVAEALGEGR